MGGCHAPLGRGASACQRRVVPRFASAVCPASLALLLASCSTMQMAGTEVELPVPVEEACLEAGFRARKDVINFRREPVSTGSGWWFQLADPDLVGKDVPWLLLTQRKAGGRAHLDLEANFSTSRSQGATLRHAMVEREQEMLTRVIERCTGGSVTFEKPRACGKGETDTICVTGQLLAP